MPFFLSPPPHTLIYFYLSWLVTCGVRVILLSAIVTNVADDPHKDLGDENSDGASEPVLALEISQQQSLRNDLIQVSGETALLRYIEKSQNTPQTAEDAVTAAPFTTSITSVLHDTLNVGEDSGPGPSGDLNEPVVSHDPKGS